MNAHNEQHFTAADMADQAASAFERGRESVLAERTAAAQEAVCWQRKYIGATRGDRPVEWHTITKDEFEATKAGKWADRYEVRALYAAPVTAAPACLACEGRPSGENIPCAVCKITPAAPGIDLRNAILHLRDDALDLEDPGDTVNAYDRVLRLIDASPNGGHFVDATKMVQDSPKGGSEAAWNDCKVAFGFDGDADAIWDAWQRGQLSLPSGWALNETDGAGARMVAVFRVDGVPAPQDGETVRKLLDMLEKAQAGDAEVSK